MGNSKKKLGALKFCSPRLSSRGMWRRSVCGRFHVYTIGRGYFAVLERDMCNPLREQSAASLPEALRLVRAWHAERAAAAVEPSA